MKQVILPAFALVFMASCGGEGTQRTVQQTDTVATVAEQSPVQISSETAGDIWDETTIMDIYNLIPDKKEGFKTFNKGHAQYFFQEKLLRENEGVNDYLTESLHFYKYSNGGWLLIFCRGGDSDDSFVKLYDYKDGKLTPSKMTLPVKNTKDLVEDYLFFLGAEDRVADEMLTAGPSLSQDTLSCYYDPNDGYEFDFDYAYGYVKFAWDGEKFVEQALVPSRTDYINEFGLNSYWTVKGIKIGEPRPTAIKGYEIKEENGAFVYYLKGEKRFSVVENESGVQRIDVFASNIARCKGYTKTELEELGQNFVFEERNGKTCAVRRFENCVSILYYFDDRGEKVESISVVNDVK